MNQLVMTLSIVATTSTDAAAAAPHVTLITNPVSRLTFDIVCLAAVPIKFMSSTGILEVRVPA